MTTGNDTKRIKMNLKNGKENIAQHEKKKYPASNILYFLRL